MGEENYKKFLIELVMNLKTLRTLKCPTSTQLSENKLEELNFYLEIIFLPLF